MSNDDKTVVKSGGIGFLGALTILFIALKLTDVIAWSWWWVLAPMWVPSAVMLGVLVIMLVIAGVVAVIDHNKKSKK